MKIPEEVKHNKNQVCKLNNAQRIEASGQVLVWNLWDSIKKELFLNSLVERYLYISDRKDVLNNIYVILYFDDLVIPTTDAKEMNIWWMNLGL